MSQPPTRSRLGVTAAACTGLVLGMVGLAFASVPLYNLFCKATGYDGTPLVGTGPSKRVSDDKVTVRFDTNVAPGLNWRFRAEQPSVEAKLGETKTVFFQVRNAGSTPSTGIATFNLQPGQVGGHFVKIQCFCFNEQTLDPGEAMDVPVVFYVEPELREDPSTRDYEEITLSYTYFASKNSKPVAAVEGGTKSN